MRSTRNTDRLQSVLRTALALPLRLVACGVAALLLTGAASKLEGVPDSARGADAFDESNPRVEAQLLVDAAELRAGQRVLVGVLFEMDPGWHIYWRNSGESGLPTELAWSSDQAEVGSMKELRRPSRPHPACNRSTGRRSALSRTERRAPSLSSTPWSENSSRTMAWPLSCVEPSPITALRPTPISWRKRSSGLPACSDPNTVEDLLSVVQNQDFGAFHAQLNVYMAQGLCGTYVGKFVVTQRIRSQAILIEGQNTEFTTVAIQHSWEGRHAEYITFTNRKIMTPEEYVDYLEHGEPHRS